MSCLWCVCMYAWFLSLPVFGTDAYCPFLSQACDWPAICLSFCLSVCMSAQPAIHLCVPNGIITLTLKDFRYQPEIWWPCLANFRAFNGTLKFSMKGLNQVWGQSYRFNSLLASDISLILAHQNGTDTYVFIILILLPGYRILLLGWYLETSDGILLMFCIYFLCLLGHHWWKI